MQSSLRFWMISAVLLALLSGLFAFGVIQWNLVRFTNLANERLMLINELRQGALKEYFSTAEAELHFWSTSPEIVQAQGQLQAIWNEGGNVAAQVRASYIDANPHPEGSFRSLDDAGDGSDYSALHRELHARAKLFVTQRGYYDFFLIGPEGDIFYSVEKEPDFASNLSWGQWSGTGLAQVFETARREAGSIALSDMQPYAPSDNVPAMFMATTINDAEGEFLGVIAFQMPTDEILSIMTFTRLAGETGETYLVGEDGLMRSNSRFIEESTILSKRIETTTVQRALAGETGVETILDYRGVEVMSAFSSVEVGDARWAVIVEIDVEEIVRLSAQDRPALAGILAVFYGLSLWSLWYWRGRDVPGGQESLAALDFGDSDGGGFGA